MSSSVRQRRNGRQWWNGALLERQMLLLMRIGDAVVLCGFIDKQKHTFAAHFAILPRRNVTEFGSFLDGLRKSG